MSTYTNRCSNVLALMFILALVGCNTFVRSDALKDSVNLINPAEPDFQPIEPMESNSFQILRTINGKSEWQTLYWADLADNIDLLNKYLPNHNASVVVLKKDESGNLKFTTATLSGEAGSYRVLMDYMKYRIDSIYSTNEYELGPDGNPKLDGNKNPMLKYLGTGKVGVGLRISADLLTVKSGVDLGSLFALGVAAKQGEIRGSLSVDVIGVDSKDVTNLIPMNAIIDESSITQALQALASIKSKLHDKDVVLTPQVIAIRKANISIKDAQVVKGQFKLQ